jgi:uncharacterized protein
MPLLPDPAENPTSRRVVGYTPTEVRLDDRVLTRSSLVFGRTIQHWPVKQVEDLDRDTLAPLLALGAEVVLLATGPRQQFPSIGILRAAREAGVALEVMDIGAACRTYNVLVAEDRAVALALIIA